MSSLSPARLDFRPRLLGTLASLSSRLLELLRLSGTGLRAVVPGWADWLAAVGYLPVANEEETDAREREEQVGEFGEDEEPVAEVHG